MFEERVKLIQHGKQSRRFKPDEKFNALRKYTSNNNHLCSANYEENGMKLGVFQDNFLGALSGNNQYFRNILSIWKEEFKKDGTWWMFEERLKNISNGRSSRKFNPEEKFNAIRRYTLNNNSLCFKNYEENGMNLGSFQNSLLGALTGRNDRFRDEVPRWKDGLIADGTWGLFEKRLKNISN